MRPVLPTDAESFFDGSPQGLAICRAFLAVVGGLGDFRVNLSKSQIALRRHRGFAYLWRPDKYVHSRVPAVLSLALPYELGSPRFKEVVHPAPSVWMHHLELHDPSMVDAEVRQWIREAFEAA
ncbi:hypothetical protein HAV21_13435 [Paenarthrobacter sp. MSM-2-10-13]|uniref:DUF5655 domain-containing protein n=1 Tax=Paenarthrobacter sp. MSM-2-10-13 TaxID=2717318 RepID=UPI00141F9CCE|nr:DUF5655 domain-containing protein [Paenarthrobacter sp. MSM-2-10-13]NHW47874.1 hypothetical protein [Paenarthrobacter sp. MSM-2-10-13]